MTACEVRYVAKKNIRTKKIAPKKMTMGKGAIILAFASKLHQS
jgi:hypothetical protein